MRQDLAPLNLIIEDLAEAVYFLAKNAPGPDGEHAMAKVIEARARFQSLLDNTTRIDALNRRR